MNEFEALNAILIKDNWQEELEARSITIKWSEDQKFFLLKYNQLKSDFNDPVVRACRGIIYAANKQPFRCVCAPFVKFGNYGEGYCPNIDWSSARVLEKIDGSLMKIWFYKGKWHLSTNGTIDAYSAEINENMSFGELFEKALRIQLHMSFDEFTENLTPNFTYMFELTSPENQIIIKYNDYKIWYLSRRDMQDMREDYYNDTKLERPDNFHISNLQDCLKVVLHMSKDQEGVVVNDKYFNRIKVKSPEYLIAAHLVNNHQITTRRIIQMIKDLSIDDFLAYCQEYNEEIDKIQNIFSQKANSFNSAWNAIKKDVEFAGEEDSEEEIREKKKKFAKIVSHYRSEKDFLFWKYNHITLKAEDFLISRTVAYLKRMVEKCLN